MTGEQVQVSPRLAGLDQVAHAARRLRYQLQKVAGLPSDYSERYADKLCDDASAILADLYDLLLRPLSDTLDAAQVCRLTIVPHGPLHGLPFHGFRDGDVWAGDRWEFLYAPSAALWRLSAQRAASRADAAPHDLSPALLLGSGDALPHVAAEIRQIAELLPGAHVFTGPDATRGVFSRHAPRCRRVHLATHAQFRNDNPLFSGMQLADDYLMARDLYGMRLANCELATLSACRTGVGHVEAGDELFGLPRGFLAAGARSVAASLWPVDDRATSELMTEFYRRQETAGKAQALRLAQSALRKTRPHPYYWAGWILIGER